MHRCIAKKNWGEEKWSINRKIVRLCGAYNMQPTYISSTYTYKTYTYACTVKRMHTMECENWMKVWKRKGEQKIFLMQLISCHANLMHHHPDRDTIVIIIIKMHCKSKKKKKIYAPHIQLQFQSGSVYWHFMYSSTYKICDELQLSYI